MSLSCAVNLASATAAAPGFTGSLVASAGPGVPYLRPRVFWRVESACSAGRLGRAGELGGVLAAGRLEAAQGIWSSGTGVSGPTSGIADKDRERRLLALGNTYAALGRRKMALTTVTSLATFDPRN